MRFSVAVIISFVFMWSPELVSAQITIGGGTSDTLYFKVRGNGMLKSAPKKSATRYMVQFYENGVLTERRLCYVGTNNLIQHKFYIDGRPSGKWLYFNGAGAVIRERNFSKLVYGSCPKQDSIPPEGMVLPQFEGGDPGLLKYLGEKIKYPEESMYSHTTGTLYITFVLDEFGKPKDLKICDQGLDGYCDLVVWEIVENMPLWIPGMYEDETVEVLYYLPIRFSLR